MVKKKAKIWTKAGVFAIVEFILAIVMIFLYLIFTWILLGEGSNSLLYSEGNKIIASLLPIFIVTAFNMIKMTDAVKINNAQKAKTFELTQIILLILYIPFLIWQSRQK